MWLLGIGPIVLSAAFAARAVRPSIDPLLLGISVALVAATFGTLLLNRIAAGALTVLAVSTFQPLVTRDISFNIASADSRLWNMWAIVAIISIGWSLVAGVVVLAGRPLTGVNAIIGSTIGALLGVGLVWFFPLMSGQPTSRFELSDGELAELPEIAMVNYSYGLPTADIPITDAYLVKLTNPSDRPHTLTIEATDTDVFVPAHRWTVVEIDTTSLAITDILLVCTIGDHQALGMSTNIRVTQ